MSARLSNLLAAALASLAVGVTGCMTPAPRPQPAAPRPAPAQPPAARPTVTSPPVTQPAAAERSGAPLVTEPPDSAPTLAVDASPLHAMRLAYAVLLRRDSTTDTLGARAVTVAPVQYGSQPAWAIRDSTSGPHLQASIDSLVADAGTLAPRHWEGKLGLARVAVEFARDTIFGAIAAPAVRKSIVRPGAPALVPNAADLEMLLALAPLGERWSASVSLLSTTVAGAEIVPATLWVMGNQTVATPAGEFECWVVGLRAGDVEKRYWVRKQAPAVVRTVQAVRDPAGAILETVLLPPD